MGDGRPSYADRAKFRIYAEPKQIEENALLQSRLITLQPKADFYDHVAGSEALFDRADAAKLLRTGPKRLWNLLREWKIVQASGKPYQKYYRNPI